MGFLKELFESKLKKAGALDIEGVQQSSLSEYSLPQLRSPGAQLHPDKLRTLQGGDELHGHSELDYMQSGPQQSAKSFSYTQVRRQQMETAEALQAQMAASRIDQPSPANVQYESINQFSQKVELYRGSVSTVYKGVCNVTGSKVIIKAYHKSRMQAKHHHKLAREIASMKTLNGPYVAEFYSSFEDDGCVYIIMELCEGGDLFKTMLMHGGSLEEQWVCVEVITPLLRILEKMHNLSLLHRDIKPENIFLTALGKFRLGDFGLAINTLKELAFSRSGTLDYMAPEVLKNPSVPFQEGPTVQMEQLSARGVKPYGPPVDVWAAGVLAYELVVGRPPFEVEDEAQTAALIMYSDQIRFPASKTPQWADFVRAALVKSPDARPSASALLQHPWIQHNMQRTLMDHQRPSKEMLLRPLPLNKMLRYTRELERSLSMCTGVKLPSSLPPLNPKPVADRQRVEGHSAPGAEVHSSPLAHESSRMAGGNSDPGALRPQLSLGSPKAPASPSGLKPLKVALPPDLQVDLSGASFDYGSPTTPVPKPGIKERMKFYFQRQAGSPTGMSLEPPM